MGAYEFDPLLSIDYLNFNQEVILYPNPTNESLCFSGLESTSNQIKIINQLGKVVIDSKIINELNVSNLPKGTYILLLNTIRGTLTRKFIKE